MRIVVLGGAGVMGSAAVMDLVRSGVSEVIVADYNLEGAKQVADQYKGQKSRVSAQFVDANDSKSLVQTMRNADAVASAIGPFHKYGVKVLKGAIDVGVDFVDLNDDYDATRDALALDDRAEKANVTAIIGLGASPGLTNILAKCGTDKLDRVNEIHTAWAVVITDPSGPAALDHWFHCITGMVPTYRNGKWVDLPAGSGPEIVDFPPKIEVFHVGHPEPVTLPRYIEGVKVVTNKGGIVPAWLNQLYLRLVDLGFGSTKTLKVKGISITPRDFTLGLFHALGDFASPEALGRMLEEAKETMGGMRIDVLGEKDGKATKLTYRLGASVEVAGAMAATTSIPLSIGAQMLARGEIKVGGVFAPEGCVNSKAFLDQLKKRGFEIYETVEETHFI